MIDRELLVYPESPHDSLPEPRQELRSHQEVEYMGAVRYAINNAETDTLDSATVDFPSNIVSAFYPLTNSDITLNTGQTHIDPPMPQLDVELKSDNSRCIRAAIGDARKFASPQSSNNGTYNDTPALESYSAPTPEEERGENGLGQQIKRN